MAYILLTGIIIIISGSNFYLRPDPVLDHIFGLNLKDLHRRHFRNYRLKYWPVPFISLHNTFHVWFIRSLRQSSN
jgi:hypothetical protein